MNQNYKSVLLTVLTLSVFTLTIVELTGVSRTAIFNKFHEGGSEPASAAAEPGGATFDKFREKADTRTKKVAEMPATTMEFAESKFNFGQVEEGKKVKHSFKFKNTGTNPLMISKTDVSCGCTVTSYSLEPVAPGAGGEITVEFNSSGKSGHQQKNILVHSNAQPEAQSIGFEADVK